MLTGIRQTHEKVLIYRDEYDIAIAVFLDINK